MLGDYPYTLFQTLPVPLAARGKKGRRQGGEGTLSTTQRLVPERKKNPATGSLGASAAGQSRI